MTPVSFTPVTGGITTAPPGEKITYRPTGENFSTVIAQTDGAIHTPLTGANTSQLSPITNSVNEPTNWGHLVQQMVRDVNQSQATAGEKVRDVLAGGPTPVHEALIATEEASVSFQVLAEMRNKVVDAYQEVMRMSV